MTSPANTAVARNQCAAGQPAGGQGAGGVHLEFTIDWRVNSTATSAGIWEMAPGRKLIDHSMKSSSELNADLAEVHDRPVARSSLIPMKPSCPSMLMSSTLVRDSSMVLRSRPMGLPRNQVKEKVRAHRCCHRTTTGIPPTSERC